MSRHLSLVRLAGRFSQTEPELARLAPALQPGETPLAVIRGQQPSLVTELRRMQVPLFRRRSVLLATDRRLLFTEPVVPASAGERIPPRVHAFPWSDVRLTPQAHKVLNRGADTYQKVGFLTTYRTNWGLSLSTPAGTYEFIDISGPPRLRTVVETYLSAHPEMARDPRPELPPSATGLLAAVPTTLGAIIVLAILAAALVIGLVVIYRAVF